MAFGIPFLSLGPRVRVTGDVLIASTGISTFIMTLALSLRTVTVSRKKRLITIDDRYGWAFDKVREVHFSEVRAVTYGYKDASTMNALFSAGVALDVYKVGLRLFDDECIHLFHFRLSAKPAGPGWESTMGWGMR